MKQTTLFFSFLILCFGIQKTFAQSVFTIKKTQEKINIDGILNENIWQSSSSFKDFVQTFPNNGELAKTKTEVKVTFDDNNLYVAAICYDDVEGEFVVQSLKRDYSFPASDAFAVNLNPSRDKTNGFNFSTTPLGVQREGLIQNGGNWGVSTAWDAKWFSEVKQEAGKWTVEMRIPFTSIRFSEADTVWLMNFARNDLKRNETSSWELLPINFNAANLSFTKPIRFSEAPKKPGLNYAIIPSAIVGHQNNFEANEQSQLLNAGIDGKLAVSSSLNLDLTINPDFSTVEIDQVDINLTAYSFYLQERRQFFIENSDLFANFGFTQIRPFYSRRIGLENGQNIPIVGARLSGKLDQNWRIGYMSVGTVGDNLSDDENYISPKLYTVAAVQRKLFKASNIGMIFVQKDAYTNTYGHQTGSNNRVLGVDYNLASNDRKWIGNILYHASIPQANEKNTYTHASFIRYQKQPWEVAWNHEYVGHNYNPEVGFVPKLFNRDDSLGVNHRRTFWRLEPNAKYSFFPKGSKVHNHGISWRYDQYMDSTFNTYHRDNRMWYFFNFRDNSHIDFKVQRSYRFLRYPINITRVEGDPLLRGEYFMNEVGFKYYTNSRENFYGTISMDYGEFYIGRKTSTSLILNYRHQPLGTFSINTTYHNITYPEPYGDTRLFLITPRADLSFSKKIFFTGLVRIDTQMEDMSFYTKLQYRFAPMSDIYFVYTDKYDVNFVEKNRLFLLKFVYWLSK